MKTLDDRLLEFWNAFNSENPEDVLNCADLAGSIIPEMEDEISTLREALKGISLALGVEHAKHTPAVMSALIRARTVLNIMAQNHN